MLARVRLVGWLSVLALASSAGCRPSEDDPEGQAEMLHDAVRRQAAIANLTKIYTGALACCEKTEDPQEGEQCKACDRAHPKVKAIADVIVDDLVEVYLESGEMDSRNGLAILDLLKEMRDARSVDALVKALDWKAGRTEEHAIRAAQTIQRMEVPGGAKGKLVDALAKALDRVEGDRPLDNRLRIELLRALGALKDPSATRVLTEIATRQSEDQNFLINRLAAQQLGEVADASAIEPMIKALFLFDPNNPAMRMNDVAAEVLVRIGRPALQPILKVLQGQHEQANAIAKAYIEAIKARDPQAAAQMSVEQFTSGEATFVLGALGFPEALQPLLKETRGDNLVRRVNAAIALVRLNLANEADRAKVREALTSVYQAAEVAMKPQLIAAMRHLYDAALLPFLLEQAGSKDLHPAVRLEAVKAYALLANQAEAAKLRALIGKEPASEKGGYRERFEQLSPALDAARECNENVACWVKKLQTDPKPVKIEAGQIDPGKLLLRKAAYMLGRLGRGNAQAIEALVARLDHPDIQVRLAALAALDRAAVRGSEKAVAKIAQMREKEEGRAVWAQFSREALPVQARLRNRAGGR